MKLSKLFTTMLFALFALVAMAQQPQTNYDFTQDSLNGIDSIYFVLPQALPNGSQSFDACTYDETYHIQLINAADTATATAWLEVTNFPNQDSWAQTGDSVNIVGAASAVIEKTGINYLYRRIKMKQTNTATSFGDCSVRTVKSK